MQSPSQILRMCTEDPASFCRLASGNAQIRQQTRWLLQLAAHQTSLSSHLSAQSSEQTLNVVKFEGTIVSFPLKHSVNKQQHVSALSIHFLEKLKKVMISCTDSLSAYKFWDVRERNIEDMFWHIYNTTLLCTSPYFFSSFLQVSRIVQFSFNWLNPKARYA